MDTKILAEVFLETDLAIIQQLDERQRRLYCATRAISMGTHGVAAVCASIPISRNTVYKGIHELKDKTALPEKAVRVSGGGRKPILEEHPEYLTLFDEIVQNHMAGLPQDDSVRWLDLSVAQIIQLFKDHAIGISEYLARKMIKLRGFKKRSFHKTKTLKEVEDREAQFKLVESTWTSCARHGIPVLSIDTKNILVLQNAFEKTRKHLEVNVLSINTLSDFIRFPMFAELTLKKT